MFNGKTANAKKLLYLIFESRGLLEAVDPAVPDAVGDGGEDDDLAFVGLHREAEVSGQVPLLDPANQTEIDDAVKETLHKRIFFRSVQDSRFNPIKNFSVEFYSTLEY